MPQTQKDAFEAFYMGK